MSIAIYAKGGKSAYDIALDNGFVGTAVEWLDSLNGADAYTIALDNGFVGTIDEWLESLKGGISPTLENNGMVLSSNGTELVWVVPDKNFVGLGFVDNTSDLDKPVSTLTQAELDKKVDIENLPDLTQDIINNDTFSIDQGEL